MPEKTRVFDGLAQRSGQNVNRTLRRVGLDHRAAYLPPFGLGDFTVLTLAGPSLAELGATYRANGSPFNRVGMWRGRWRVAGDWDLSQFGEVIRGDGRAGPPRSRCKNRVLGAVK